MRTNNGGSGESPLFGSFDSPCRHSTVDWQVVEGKDTSREGTVQNAAHGGVAPRHHHVSWEACLALKSCGWVENAGGYPGSWDDDGQGGSAPISWMDRLDRKCSTQSRGQSGMLGLHTRMCLGGELANVSKSRRRESISKSTGVPQNGNPEYFWKCAAEAEWNAHDQLKGTQYFLVDFTRSELLQPPGPGGAARLTRRSPSQKGKLLLIIYSVPKRTIAGAVETIQSSTAVRSFIGGGQVQRKPSLTTEVWAHRQQQQQQQPQDEAIQDGQINSVLVMACDGWCPSLGRSGHGIGVLVMILNSYFVWDDRCQFDAFHTASCSLARLTSSRGTYAKKSRIRSFVQIHPNEPSSTKYTV
ncbi:uncharacterized protein BO96DRAFT_436605 [Aspergillus niger CBS 101883]|uniref:uncharacterized protein n=1 Tax=Aspergillus lacticoffeatus (strain CBS 101883) TaxID=1450533 RepID=UPI000D804E78|nr:uncharacterized protein BO96DRAFT_436605 [Aspergillus niger CBS 101883]PYH54124.1 hypothetical protein BO96DRAFT_436605 [Aspergillus niger CBS 101883]